MLIIGKINPEHFIGIASLTTIDVVITEKQIAHIERHHPCDYHLYAKYLPNILESPDFILKANKADSVVFRI